MAEIEEKVKKYNQVKTDLLRVVKCIDCCTEAEEKEFYQDVAVSYSKELKRIKGTIKSVYGIDLCGCCSFSDK